MPLSQAQFTSDEAFVNKMLQLITDENQDVTRSVAAAIAALAENNSDAKDLFVQLGFAQKICDRILFANNNSLARSMLVTLG